ncbi:hypothetical protein BH11ACT8_BH11ACT8_21380 [soil metagenome]
MPPLTAGRYAAIASTLALVVALGGTGYAATRIGTAQIKNNAVTTPKIKNNAILSTKIKNGAVNGNDINESTLSKVPSAAVADRVNGVTVDPIHFVVPGGTPPTTILRTGGLTVQAACSAGLDITLTARTSTVASIYTVVSGDGAPQAADPVESDLESEGFMPADSFDLLVGQSGNIGIVEFDYLARDGSAVSGHLAVDEFSKCSATGFAMTD